MRDNLCLAIIFSLFVFAACAEPAEKITGEVEASEIDVGIKLAGRLETVFVHEGDIVKKGERLAKLESKEIEAKKKTALAAFNEAQHQLDFAQKSYMRIDKLFRSGLIAKQEYDEMKYKYEAAKQKVEASSGVLNEISAYYDDLSLLSPIDGEVVDIISHTGEIVAAGYPVLTLMNPADKWIVFNLREDKLAGLKKGDRLEAEFPALGKTYTAEVFYIRALGAFAKWKATSESGSFDLKTFEVRARTIEPVREMLPGMTALLWHSDK